MVDKNDNLTEAVQTEKIDAINNYIKDICDLRKNSLATEGEYGIGNLIFKTARSKGYLDNLNELKNKLIGDELSLRALEEDFRLFKNKNFDKLLDEGDYGNSKLSLITAINSLQKNYITKSSEKFNIGNKSYNKWKAVLHHINGDRANNNLENLVLILDNTGESPKKAELAHKLIHLYAAAYNSSIIQNKILDMLSDLDNTVEYIMFDGSKITKFNFTDWWKSVGNILVNCYADLDTDEILNNEIGADEDLNLADDQIYNLKELNLDEGTEKIKDHKWVNRGKEGTHGEFKTKKEANAQRKAMFANGFSESLTDKATLENISKTTLQEDNEFGKYKAAFIKSILQANPTAIHKGAESRKIYNKASNEMEEKLLWDSVLHHTDGEYNNNAADFSNYTLIQGNNYSTAMLVHRLVHLLSIVKEELIEEVKNKIKDCDAEFITLLDNKLAVQDFDSWWNNIGNIITDFASDKIINMKLKDTTLINERLEEKQRIDYRNELSRIAHNQAIIFDSGIFKIYNVKENDVNRIINQIRDLEYIDWADKRANKYDFSTVAMFGQLQAKYYEITGQIKN